MAKDKIANLLGNTFGSWKVIAFEAVITTSAHRGSQGGKGTGEAKRAHWLCKCIMCGTHTIKRTDYITGNHIHQPCRTAYQEWKTSEIKRNAAAVFGGVNV